MRVPGAVDMVSEAVSKLENWPRRPRYERDSDEAQVLLEQPATWRALQDYAEAWFNLGGSRVESS
jgi:hypothetical protein